MDSPSVLLESVTDEDGRLLVRLTLKQVTARTIEGDPYIVLDAEESIAVGEAAIGIGHLTECGGTIQ